MPTNNNTKATLLQCAICPKRLSCPFGQFSNQVREKYCPVLDIARMMAPPAGERSELQEFLHIHTN